MVIASTLCYCFHGCLGLMSYEQNFLVDVSGLDLYIITSGDHKVSASIGRHQANWQLSRAGRFAFWIMTR